MENNSYWKLDFNEKMRATLKDFISKIVPADTPNIISELAQTIQKKILSREKSEADILSPTSMHRDKMTFNKVAPPKAPTSSSFKDYEAKELQEQLTILEFDMFKSMHPIDFFHQIDYKVSKSQKFEMFTKRGAQTTSWVATEILKESNLEKQSQNLVKFIDIALLCYEDRNFNALNEITAGLQLEPVKAIKAWDLVPPKKMEDFDKIKTILLPVNMPLYKAMLNESTSSPSLPWLSNHVVELIAFDEYTPNTVPSADNKLELINFEKFYTLASKIEEILQFKEQLYSYQPNPVIRNYIITALEDIMDMTQMNSINESRAKSNQKVLEKLLGSGKPVLLDPAPNKLRRFSQRLPSLENLTRFKKKTKEKEEKDELESLSVKELVGMIRKLEEDLRIEQEASLKANERIKELEEKLRR